LHSGFAIRFWSGETECGKEHRGEKKRERGNKAGVENGRFRTGILFHNRKRGREFIARNASIGRARSYGRLCVADFATQIDNWSG
jgi:hypothetical protein